MPGGHFFIAMCKTLGYVVSVPENWQKIVTIRIIIPAVA